MSDYCKNCGGEGYIDSDNHLSGWKHCPACKGTGKDTSKLERLRAKARRRDETIEEA